MYIFHYTYIIKWNISQPQRKNEILSFLTTQMDTDCIMLSEMINKDDV